MCGCTLNANDACSDVGTEPISFELRELHFSSSLINAGVLDPVSDLDIKLLESEGPAQRKVGKPLFLCVPTEEWHHHEHFPATHPMGCFVVYELDPREHSGDISLMDQFGLNQISVSKSNWLCVRAMMLFDFRFFSHE